jgi:hypothetical protein
MWYVARMGEITNEYNILVDNAKARSLLKDQRVD